MMKCNECGATAEQWHKPTCSHDLGQQVKYSKDTEAPDYDLSIHTNPDAQSWASFYAKCRDQYEAANPGKRFDSDDNMLGWFANAMMAMHDHMRPDLAPVVLDDGSAVFVANV